LTRNTARSVNRNDKGKEKVDRIQTGDLDLLPTLTRISGDSSIMILPLKSKELPVLEMINAGSHLPGCRQQQPGQQFRLATKRRFAGKHKSDCDPQGDSGCF